jgi:uncharacterized glyoxalase superfamily protein PhnB
MLNFRVLNLDAMLAQLRNLGADVAPEAQEMDGVGRFGWVTDPEGNGWSCGSRLASVLRPKSDVSAGARRGARACATS